MTGLISTPLLFAVYTAFSVTGMVLVKQAAPMLRAARAQGDSVLVPGFMFAGGAGLYVVGFLVWMIVLTRLPLTIAYPVAVGLTMAFSTVCAVVFLHEPMTIRTTLGALLVFAGVVLLARG